MDQELQGNLFGQKFPKKHSAGSHLKKMYTQASTINCILSTVLIHPKYENKTVQ
jgi:hypothetical protein